MREIRMSGSMSGVWKRKNGRASEAPPTESGGQRICPTYPTAPNLDSTAESLIVPLAMKTYTFTTVSLPRQWEAAGRMYC